MVQGLWKIVSVKDNKPVLTVIPKVEAVFNGTGADRIVVQMQKPETNNQDKIDQWEADDMQANGILNMYVDIEIRGMHMKDTSYETWQALLTQYGIPSSIVVRGLIHDMNNYTVVDHVRKGKDFPAQLEELSGLMTKVHSAGHSIEQMQRVILITEALSPKWKQMVDAAMVARVFKDVDTTIRLLTQKHDADQSAKKAHTAMPAKITGLQRYTPKPQNQGQQQQPRPGPSNQTARIQKNTQKQPANAGAPAPTAEQKQKKKAINKARKDRKKANRAAMATLQAEDTDGVLIDRMSNIALTVADSGALFFNERSFMALMAENDASIGQDERAADGLLSEETEMLILNKGKRPASTSSLADWLEQTRASHSRINTPPATAPSTPPPTLISTSPSSMGYTDDEDEDVSLKTTVTRRSPVESGDWMDNYPGDGSIRLVIRNHDPSETELEDGPLPVPPPRSVSAAPISL